MSILQSREDWKLGFRGDREETALVDGDRLGATVGGQATILAGAAAQFDDAPQTTGVEKLPALVFRGGFRQPRILRRPRILAELSVRTFWTFLREFSPLSSHACRQPRIPVESSDGFGVSGCRFDVPVAVFPSHCRLRAQVGY